MNAELFITKAVLQIKKGDMDNAACSMKKAIEIGDDIVAVAQARCFLGEYYFLNGDYVSSKKNLKWVDERREELETEYDDLLQEEFERVDVLLAMIEKFALAE